MTDCLNRVVRAKCLALQTPGAAVKINPRLLMRVLAEDGLHRASPFHLARLAVAAFVRPDQRSRHASSNAPAPTASPRPNAIHVISPQARQLVPASRLQTNSHFRRKVMICFSSGPTHHASRITFHASRITHHASRIIPQSQSPAPRQFPTSPNSRPDCISAPPGARAASELQSSLAARHRPRSGSLAENAAA